MAVIEHRKHPARHSRRFPIICKTWKEFREIKEQYCTPVGKTPKGVKIYDHAEVTKYAIPPKG
jgi:hypothetical protein